MTDSQIANAAHDYAAKFVALTGHVPSEKWDNAELAARLKGLTGAQAELFVHRAVGHWVNVEAGTPGV